jgi:hypothetical protein
MLKNKMIQLRAFILLLVYLASNIPVSLFHKHENVVVALEKATACEKKIYYGEVNSGCEHSTHISKQIEKCSLCDSHLNTPHYTVDIFYSFQKNNFSIKYCTDDIHYSSSLINTLCNKGPPTV